MGPEDRSVHYRRLLAVRSPRKLNDLIDVNIAGGYRLHHHPTPTVYPSFDKFKRFHVLTDDHLVINLRNRSYHELYVNIMAFDSAFGISKVYPTLEDASMTPVLHPPDSAQVIATIEVSIELRMSLDKFNTDIEDDCQETEVLKIFFLDRHLSLNALEIPRIRHAGFLENNRDPAAAHFLPETNSQDSVEGFATSQVKDGPGKDMFRSAPKENWYCYDLPITMHSTARSLEAAFTTDQGVRK